MLRKISTIILIGLLFSSCNYLADPNFAGGTSTESRPYKMINVEELQEIMDKGDITLINVHIPLEGNMQGTDLTIPFDEVENFLDLLPEDKDTKIVVYCRSGSMGDIASEKLADLGYTNISNLDGGYNVWKAMDLPFEE